MFRYQQARKLREFPKVSYIAFDQELNLLWRNDENLGIKAPAILDLETVKVDDEGKCFCCRGLF